MWDSAKLKFPQCIICSHLQLDFQTDQYQSNKEKVTNTCCLLSFHGEDKAKLHVFTLLSCYILIFRPSIHPRAFCSRVADGPGQLQTELYQSRVILNFLQSMLLRLPLCSPMRDFSTLILSGHCNSKFATQHTSGSLMADVPCLEYPWDGY